MKPFRLFLIALAATMLGTVLSPSRPAEALSSTCALLNTIHYHNSNLLSAYNFDLAPRPFKAGEVITLTWGTSDWFASLSGLGIGPVSGDVGHITYTIPADGYYNFTLDLSDPWFPEPLTYSFSCSAGGTHFDGPSIPVGFVLKTVTCDQAVFDSPGGSPVGGNRFAAGATWFMNPAPKADAQGRLWTEVFVGGWNDGWILTSCTR